MSKKAAEMTRRRSILYAALAKACAKRVDKTHLVEGATERVFATIVGTVGRATVDAEVRGELSIGHPSTVNKSVVAKPTAIVAALLAELPDDAARAKAIDRIAKGYKNGGLPEQPKVITEAAALLLQRLSSTTQQKKAGPVSFACSDA